MQTFEYGRPCSVQEACKMLAVHGAKAKAIAGGTDLLVQFRDGDEKWRDVDYLVDLNYIPGLSFIREENGRLHLGPLTTHSQLERSPLLRQTVPFFCEAAASVGSPQIRNRGTIGGSLCNASPAADPIIPLIVLNAEATVTGSGGSRTVSMKDVVAKPYKTSLAPDEIVTEISFDKPCPTTRMAFVKLGRRKSLAISRMNVGAAFELDTNGAFKNVRFAPGSVFAMPDRVSCVEEMLEGEQPSETLLLAAGKRMSEEMIARTGIRWSTEYKKPAIEALTRQVLAKALEVDET